MGDDRVSRALTFVIATLLTVMLVLWTGPAIETRFFPVYSKFTVETVEPAEGGALATFRFEKYRDCDAHGWAWFIGDFGSKTSRHVEARATENSTRRPLGPTVTAPYFIAATPEQVRTSMHAEIFSRCHPLWLTRSIVYP